MDEKRLPGKILVWYPPGRRRRGRPRNSWIQEVTTGMRERERERIWQLGVDRRGGVDKAQKDVKTSRICIKINKSII